MLTHNCHSIYPHLIPAEAFDYRTFHYSLLHLVFFNFSQKNLIHLLRLLQKSFINSYSGANLGSNKKVTVPLILLVMDLPPLKS